eukprot:10621847-Lingulodinium_polyedra.AAC.1
MKDLHIDVVGTTAKARAVLLKHRETSDDLDRRAQASSTSVGGDIVGTLITEKDLLQKLAGQLELQLSILEKVGGEFGNLDNVESESQALQAATGAIDPNETNLCKVATGVFTFNELYKTGKERIATCTTHEE